jgi:hypothetical protein
MCTKFAFVRLGTRQLLAGYLLKVCVTDYITYPTYILQFIPQVYRYLINYRIPTQEQCT